MANPRARPQSRRGKKHKMKAAEALAMQSWFVDKGLPLAKLKDEQGRRYIKSGVSNEEMAFVMRRVLKDL